MHRENEHIYEGYGNGHSWSSQNYMQTDSMAKTMNSDDIVEAFEIYNHLGNIYSK